jgi:aspartyl-tRNA synthetase
VAQWIDIIRFYRSKNGNEFIHDKVAICYRDETVNPFRQPEFTQLDLEMSFTDQDSIISLVEQIIVEAWPVELVGEKSTLQKNILF